MSLKQILVDAWTAIDDDGRPEAIEEFFAPDFVRHGSKDWTREEFKELLVDLRTGFPDMRRVTLDTVQEGDRVAYRWESRGTHLGPYQGVLPTGRVITARGIAISRFEGDKIVEDWTSWNELSVLHDLQILPIDR